MVAVTSHANLCICAALVTGSIQHGSAQVGQRISKFITDDQAWGDIAVDSNIPTVLKVHLKGDQVL